MAENEVTTDDIRRAYAELADLWPDWRYGRRWNVIMRHRLPKVPVSIDDTAPLEMTVAEYRAEPIHLDDLPMWRVVGRHGKVETTVDAFVRAAT